MSAKGSVLDASAVLALLHEEPGAAKVRPLLAQSSLSTVNAAEVLAKLVGKGMPLSVALETLDALHLEQAPFTGAEAAASAQFVHPRLSLGDRACLATAHVRSARAVTAERDWKQLARNVDVVLIC